MSNTTQSPRNAAVPALSLHSALVERFRKEGDFSADALVEFSSTCYSNDDRWFSVWMAGVTYYVALVDNGRKWVKVKSYGNQMVIVETAYPRELLYAKPITEQVFKTILATTQAEIHAIQQDSIPA